MRALIYLENISVFWMIKKENKMSEIDMDYNEIKKESKDLVWLPHSLAEKIKSIEDGKAVEEEIMKYFGSAKDEIGAQVQSLDDDVIRYRGFMISAKQQFKQVTDSMLVESYNMWEDWAEKMPKLNEEVKKFRDLFTPIHDDLVEIDKMMKDIDTYGLNKFMEMIEFMERLQGNNTTKMLKFLVDNYKNE